MNCGTFTRIVADFIEGKLPSDEQAAAMVHARDCDACRNLMAILSGKINTLSDERGREMVHSILQQTSGSACPRARDQLCDFVDGRLDEADLQLVGLHLNFCPDCRSITRELAAMKEDLPELAAIEPDRHFTRSVIEATSGRRPYRPGARTRLVAWWNRMVQRPRFSFEAAYLGTLVLVLVFANPVLPLGDMALRTLDSTKVAASTRDVASRLLPSSWVNAQAPPFRYTHGLLEGTSLKGKAALSTLDYLLARGGQMSASSFHWQVRTIASWGSKVGGALPQLWSGLSSRTPAVQKQPPSRQNAR